MPALVFLSLTRVKKSGEADSRISSFKYGSPRPPGFIQDLIIWLVALIGEEDLRKLTI